MEYVCPKCGKKQYKVDQICTTGGVLAKIFDVQNRNFTVISCGYFELYKRRTNTI